MNSTVTVQQAIERGMKKIALPSKVILISATALCVLLLILGFSWWYLLLLPASMLLSALYTASATPEWRIWAYEHVADIHQFQRSAELSGLLRRQSYETLITLQQRFLEEPVFIDDSSIPGKTTIQANKPVITLSDSGIQIQSERFLDWGQIQNERIAHVGFRSTSRYSNDSSGTKMFFRFECPEGSFEVPLTSLDIPAWKLDLLLYTYRDRFETGSKLSGTDANNYSKLA